MSFFTTLFKSKNSERDAQQQPKQPQAQANPPGPAPAQAEAQQLGNQMLARRARGSESSGKHNKTPSATQDGPSEAELLQEIAKERDTVAPYLAKEQLKTVKQTVFAKTVTYLQQSGKTAALRSQLKDVSVALVTLNIDNTEYSEQEKADARRYAGKLVEDKRIVPIALGKYSRDLTNQAIRPFHEKQLLQAARTGFDGVKPGSGKNLAKLLENATNQAMKNAAKEGESMAETLAKENEATIEAAMKGPLDQFSQYLNVGDLGVSEVKLRHKLDNRLIKDEKINDIYVTQLFVPIKAEVVRKFGVGRRGFRRSKELNKFRQQMKDAARAKAYAEIAEKVKNDASIEGDVTKAYITMAAQGQAYKLAKESVNKTLEDKAARITRRVLESDKVLDQLKQAAKTAAYDVARSDPTDTEKIEKAALSAASAKAAELLESKMEAAVNAARKITKGEKDNPQAGPDTKEQDKLKTGVERRVVKDNIASRAIEQTIETDNLINGFSKIAKVIDLAVPNPGDSSSFEFEIRIPIEGGIGYVLIGFGGEAEKEEDEVSVNANITFGAGFSAFGFDANFRAGLYVEAQGKNSVACVNLISYGFYRRMRKLSDRAADRLWSLKGKSGRSRTEEAEIWAAMIEEQFMGDDNYVDVGLITQLKTELKGGVAKLGLEGTYKRLSHYDKEAINRKTGGMFGKLVHDPEKEREENRKKGIGPRYVPAVPEKVKTFKEKAKLVRGGDLKTVKEVQGSFEFTMGNYKLSFEVTGSITRIRDKLREMEFEVNGSVPFEYGEDVAEWVKKLSKIASPAMGEIKNLIGVGEKLFRPEGREKPQGVNPYNRVAKTRDPNPVTSYYGSLLDMGTDALFLSSDFDEIGNKFVESIKGEEEFNQQFYNALPESMKKNPVENVVNKIGLTNSFDVTIGFSNEWKADGTEEGWTMSVSIATKKNLEVDAEIVNFNVEKAKRLFKLEFNFKEKQVKGDFMGLYFGAKD